MDESFVRLMTDQLLRVGLPLALHEAALKKIWHEVFDAGDYVMFCENILGLDDIDRDREIVFPDMPYILASKVDFVADKDVFLVDHMWMTTFPQSRSQLLGSVDLQTRIKSIIGMETDEVTSSTTSSSSRSDFDALWGKIWPHFICFPPEPDEAASSCDYIKWFLMDEVGCAIQHASSPNLKCAPIRVPFSSKQTEVFTLSLIWPVEDVSEGEILSRDYFPSSVCLPTTNLNDDVSRDASVVYMERSRLRDLRSLAYLDDSDTIYSILDDWKTEHNKIIDTAEQSNTAAATMSNKLVVDDSISASWAPIYSLLHEVKSTGRPLKIFCDRSDHINSSMIKDKSKFTLVDSADDADVLYLIDHTYEDSARGRNDMEYNKRGKMMNQFWWEGMLVTKDQLCNTVRSAYNLNVSNYVRSKSAATNDNLFPTWYPVTYDLANESELWMFIHDFNSRSKAPLPEAAAERSDGASGGSTAAADIAAQDKFKATGDNIWIMKRYQGKQSMDYPITSNLSCALRHLDPCPRLASKYVINPCLLSKKKFDLRFYVIVKSLEPLVVYRHKFFVIRWSNQDYSPSDFEEYQKHFTVMNFLDDSELKHVRGSGKRRDIHRDEFVPLFNSEYSERFSNGGEGSEQKVNTDVWGSIVLPRVHAMFVDVFDSVKKAYSTGATHPSGRVIHPNAAWSLHQPNVSTSCAMYGFDVLLNNDLNPVLMEVQWAPDCAKAVELNPNFWDSMFGAMYLDEETHIDKVC